MAVTVKLLMAGTPLIDAPRIVAERLGYFEEEGLALRSMSPGAERIADELVANPTAIALGGAWRPAMYRRRGLDLSLFGTFCHAPPHQVMARQAVDFEWRELESSVLVVPACAPSTDMLLRWVLAAERVDITCCRIVRGLDGAEAAELFAAGLGDYILVTPPVPDAVRRVGAYPVASLARQTGSVPWGVFYGLPAPQSDAGPRIRFCRAVRRGLEWVHRSDPEAICQLCADRFGQASIEAVLTGIEYCLATELWPATTDVSEDSLMRWQGVMQDYGLIDERFPFASLVDTSVADGVTRQRTEGGVR